jgi:hypothetical protein
MRAVLDTNLVIATDVPPLDGDLAISVVTIASCTSVCSSLVISAPVRNGCGG